MLRPPYPFLSLLELMLITTCLWNQPRPTGANCILRCGDVDIPYPFGIGLGCFYNDYFSVTCNSASSSSPSSSSSLSVPVLKRLNFEILRVDIVYGVWAGDVTVKTLPITACSSNNNDSTSNNTIVEAWRNGPNVKGSPFSFSFNNVFASVGCDGYAIMGNETGEIVAGCSSVCTPEPPPNGSNGNSCNGFGCCQTKYETQVQRYRIGVRVNNDGSGSCRSAFLISKDYLENNTVSSTSTMTPVPVVLSWKINQLYPTSKGEESGSRDAVIIVLLYIVLPSVGTLLLTCAIFWLCWLRKTRKRRKDVKVRAKYFKQRLEEQRTADREAVENIKLFTMKELKKATDNFNKDRILGQGGQGTVYKGMLTDGHVIAVKKSRTFDDSQWKQLINEVILLSQIEHRHVVKLLGCCLETKEPLLVYEYIPNGTLFEHIHSPKKEAVLSWELRLRIAAETAAAIGYLHSDCPTPIYHRDVKSSNILLDDNYAAKLSDFGISKAISVDQTHLTTSVQGTLGYLDPEYFQFSQFSEKSDVYSFGVVLVELLTGHKPTHLLTLEEEEEEEEEDKVSMVEYFISAMSNSITLCKILDPIVLDSNAKEEIMIVVNLAKGCLNPRGVLRPTMKEVSSALEALRCQNSSFTQNGQVNNQEIESERITSTEIGDGSLRSSTLMSMEISGPIYSHSM